MMQMDFEFEQDEIEKISSIYTEKEVFEMCHNGIISEKISDNAIKKIRRKQNAEATF